MCRGVERPFKIVSFGANKANIDDVDLEWG